MWEYGKSSQGNYNKTTQKLTNTTHKVTLKINNKILLNK